MSDSKTDAKKRASNVRRHADNRGVVYISHLPHGFYEKELRAFLGQFGGITNLRVGRSQKTGRSKGYAFVEFAYAEVAKIVSETMNNYLMFNKLLKCQVVPQEKVKSAIFKNKIDPQKPPKLRKRVVAKKIVNNSKASDIQINNRNHNRMKKLNALQKKLEEAGIETRVVFPKFEKMKKEKKQPDKVDEDGEENLKKEKKKRKSEESPKKAPAKRKKSKQDDDDKAVLVQEEEEEKKKKLASKTLKAKNNKKKKKV